MERMLVVVFDNEKKAFEGESALKQLEREGSFSIYAGAVVVKHADGTVSVKQLDDSGPIGTLTGTAVGSLIGVLGGPVGLAFGAASGLALGALYDVDNARVGEDFLDDVSKSLTPNKVAVVAEVEEEWTTPVDTRMEALGVSPAWAVCLEIGGSRAIELDDVEESLRPSILAAIDDHSLGLPLQPVRGQSCRLASLMPSDHIDKFRKVRRKQGIRNHAAAGLPLEHGPDDGIVPMQEK